MGQTHIFIRTSKEIRIKRREGIVKFRFACFAACLIDWGDGFTGPEVQMVRTYSHDWSILSMKLNEFLVKNEIVYKVCLVDIGKRCDQWPRILRERMEKSHVNCIYQNYGCAKCTCYHEWRI